MKSWLWQCMDEAVHAPGLWRLFPQSFRWWVCERFDRSLGVTWDEMDRTKASEENPG